MLKPWLEKAKVQSAAVPKPVTLQDTEKQLQQAKVFQVECKKQFSQLQGINNVYLIHFIIPSIITFY